MHTHLYRIQLVTDEIISHFALTLSRYCGMIFSSRDAVAGESSEGLRMAAFPATIAAMSGWMVSWNG